MIIRIFGFRLRSCSISLFCASGRFWITVQQILLEVVCEQHGRLVRSQRAVEFSGLAVIIAGSVTGIGEVAIVFTIRLGTAFDLEGALRLIIELAVFEKEPDAVVTTVASMLEDGFGENPVFSFFVAEIDSEIVGLSLFYDRYSTWRGKCLYLEDLIVSEKHRGTGIGRSLFERTIQKAQDDGYQGMSWQVLDWNEPAISFYERYHAKIEKGWLNASFSKAQLQQIPVDST